MRATAFLLLAATAAASENGFVDFEGVSELPGQPISNEPDKLGSTEMQCRASCFDSGICHCAVYSGTDGRCRLRKLCSVMTPRYGHSEGYSVFMKLPSKPPVYEEYKNENTYHTMGSTDLDADRSTVEVSRKACNDRCTVDAECDCTVYQEQSEYTNPKGTCWLRTDCQPADFRTFQSRGFDVFLKKSPSLRSGNAAQQAAAAKATQQAAAAKKAAAAKAAAQQAAAQKEAAQKVAAQKEAAQKAAAEKAAAQKAAAQKAAAQKAAAQKAAAQKAAAQEAAAAAAQKAAALEAAAEEAARKAADAKARAKTARQAAEAQAHAPAAAAKAAAQKAAAEEAARKAAEAKAKAKAARKAADAQAQAAGIATAEPVPAEQETGSPMMLCMIIGGCLLGVCCLGCLLFAKRESARAICRSEPQDDSQEPLVVKAVDEDREAENKRLREEEEQRKRRVEEEQEARRKAEEEAKRKAEEEAAKKKAEEEEEARRKAEEEEKKKVKASVKKKPKQAAPVYREAVFQLQKANGEKVVIDVKHKPLGFTLSATSHKVTKITDETAEAVQQGVEVGMHLVGIGATPDKIEEIGDAMDRNEVNYKINEVMKALPPKEGA